MNTEGAETMKIEVWALQPPAKSASHILLPKAIPTISFTQETVKFGARTPWGPKHNLETFFLQGSIETHGWKQTSSTHPDTRTRHT